MDTRLTQNIGDIYRWSGRIPIRNFLATSNNLSLRSWRLCAFALKQQFLLLHHFVPVHFLQTKIHFDSATLGTNTQCRRTAFGNNHGR